MVPLFAVEDCLRQNAALVTEFSVEDLPMGRTTTLIPEFAVEDLASAELQPGSCACSEGPALGQNTLMMIYRCLFARDSFVNLA